MAALQHLLPDVQLPDFLFSSKEVFRAVQQATASQPLEVQQQVAVIVARLEQLQGERLFLLKDHFLERMVSEHPDWSERIKRIRHMLGSSMSLSASKLPADVQLPQCLDNASAAMKMYQSRNNWRCKLSIKHQDSGWSKYEGCRWPCWAH